MIKGHVFLSGRGDCVKCHLSSTYTNHFNIAECKGDLNETDNEESQASSQEAVPTQATQHASILDGGLRPLAEGVKVMRPFNLAEALAGKPVVTRGGHKVTQLTQFPTTYAYVLAGVLTDGDGRASIDTWTKDGLFTDDPGRNHDFDLFMEVKEKRIWVNLWKNDDHGLPFFHATTHTDLNQAIAERTISNAGYKKTLITRFEHVYEE